MNRNRKPPAGVSCTMQESVAASMAAKPATEPLSRSTAEWMPLWACLVTALAVAWLACPAPPEHLLEWDELLVSAAAYVLIVLIVCAAVAGIGFALVHRRTSFNSYVVIVRLLTGAAWFAPLVVFGLLRSRWLLAVTVLIAVTLTRTIHRFGTLEAQTAAPTSFAGASLPRKMFQIADGPSPLRRLLYPFFIAVCIQAGAMIATAGYNLPAAIVLGLSAVMLAWSFAAQPAAVVNGGSKRAASLLIVTAVLAFFLTAIGLAPFVKLEGLWSATSGGGPAVRALLYAIFGAKSVQPPAPAPSPEVKNGSGTGNYRGVILWPEEPRAILLAPPPMEMPAGFFVPTKDNPLCVPFRGVYWFFKPPDNRPPDHSYKVKGSPEKMGMHSSDADPLLMEAHQDLSLPINLDCCSRIQVVVRNADHYAGTVSLELRLRNRNLPGKGYVSLGRALVTSKLSNDAIDDAPPVEEILNFTVPQTAPIRQFNEMTIAFRLAPQRAGASARIAIDRFVFLAR